MNPRVERIQTRCASLLHEVAESGMATAPDPEAHEEAVLGCAIIALMAESSRRNPKADHPAAVISAVINIAKSQGITPEALRELIEDRVGALYAAAARPS